MSSFPLGPVRRVARVAAALFVLAVLLPASAQALPDGRGWELVSPLDKNGGEIPAAGEVFKGGVFQAAADGGSITYSSATSFASAAQSAPPGSQYLSVRGEGGWSTADLNLSIFSGSYGPAPDGVPYQLFAPDLGRSLLLSGRHCRAEEAPCPVANPALAGTDAVSGYQNYYLRSGLGFEALIGAADLANSSLGAAEFSLRMAGTSPDLSQVLLESCAALAATATEVPLGEGCDPAKQNLYRWSGGSLTVINAAPGAALAASAGAVSSTGSVYFTEAGKLLLREGATTKEVDDEAGGGGVFQTAAANGSVAYFTKADKLWRYSAASDSAGEIASEVVGVFAASSDGARVYYLAADGLYSWVGGAATKVATATGLVPTDTSNYPPATGTTRLSADGTKLVFISTNSLTGYNNLDQKTGLPDAEVYLYDASAKALRCVSCRANGTRPIGPSSIPGAYANGALPGATAAYKPRSFSADGKRVFFDTRDGVLGADVNKEPDVYQWQAFGPGCTKGAGCIDLISNGRSEEGARFIDASLSGDDVFFVTDASLVGFDPGAFDLYDARVGGVSPEVELPIACEGDACQDLPSEPVDPALNTLVSGPGNPKVRYFKYRRPRSQGCKGKAAKQTKKCKREAKSKAKAKSKRKGSVR
jgi:hypothetical protein